MMFLHPQSENNKDKINQQNKMPVTIDDYWLFLYIYYTV